MIEAIYEIYKSGRKLCAMAKGRESKMSEDEIEFFRDLEVINDHVKNRMPEYAQRYDRELDDA